MKRYSIVLTTVFVMVFILASLMLLNGAMEAEVGSEDESSNASGPHSEAAQPPSQTAQQSESGASEPEQSQAPDIQTDDWRLILVNYQNPLPDDFAVELEMTRYGYEVDKRIVQPLEEMMQAASEDGISLIICYGHRTMEQSEQLFQKQINQQLALGLDLEQAKAEAAKWVAPPGYSEHHTGLALDIVTLDYQVLDSGFASTPAAIWMRDNAYKYGFVIRYPEDKQDITQITYEPWHVRYVGLEHAAAMTEQNLCLEEYLGALEDTGGER